MRIFSLYFYIIRNIAQNITIRLNHYQSTWFRRTNWMIYYGKSLVSIFYHILRISACLCQYRNIHIDCAYAIFSRFSYVRCSFGQYNFPALSSVLPVALSYPVLWNSSTFSTERWLHFQISIAIRMHIIETFPEKTPFTSSHQTYVSWNGSIKGWWLNK